MFLTITIDTSQKKKNKALRFKTRKARASWWKKPLNAKKRRLDQKIQAWIRAISDKESFYRPAMF